MADFYETVLTVLKSDKRFIAEDGTFLRNSVYEAAMKMDRELIRLLLSHSETRKRFFTDIDGIKVFDKTGFAWVINNRQFLPDSYTRFKNKIGLADENGELISRSEKVELVFPYKDCILEGGQTREDRRRSEIFYNETLAPDEIDRLLYPKVLTNAVRCSVNCDTDSCGSSAENSKALSLTPVSEFNINDSLIIKGNNLLSLCSLNKTFRSKVKLMYWDVPYNTGSDSFGYNDRFSRSTWLTFIKNRVEAALPLLDDKNGVLLIQCSFHQYAYLKVLLDEIVKNHIMTFNILVRHPDRTLTSDKEFNNVVEYVLVYSKSSDFKMPKIKEKKTVDDYVYSIEVTSKGKETVLGGKKTVVFTPEQYRLKKGQPSNNNFKIITVRGSIKEKNSSGRFYTKYLKPIEKDYPPKTLFMVEGIGDDSFAYRYFYTPPEGNKNGAYLQGMPSSSSYTYKPYPDFLNFVQSYNTVNDEGIVEFRNGKKPEELIAYFVKMFTSKNDIILDAFAGSGTTAAVALKMNRRFILIEQMDYIYDVTVKRILGVLKGEEKGLLPDDNCCGKKSFVCCELAKLNQSAAEEIEASADSSSLNELYEKMLKSGFISCRVNPSAVNDAAEDYNALSIDDKKRFLMEILDKNLLYVNYCDIDDEEFGISDKDKAFTKSFYGEE